MQHVHSSEARAHDYSVENRTHLSRAILSCCGVGNHDLYRFPWSPCDRLTVAMPAGIT